MSDNVKVLCENVIRVEGKTDDLLNVSDDMKMTRLFHVFPENEDEDCETLDITITSTNPHGHFPIFDKLIGKKIRIDINVVY